MLIDDKILNRLRDRDLWVSHPIPAFSGGVWVVKPKTTKGNFIPHYEPAGLIFLEGDPAVSPCPDSDAPMLKLMHPTNKWEVHGWDCSGGMGPADFCNQWGSADEALADIFEFYFGDEKRIRAKEAFHKDPPGEIEKAKQENRMPKSPFE